MAALGIAQQQAPALQVPTDPLADLLDQRLYFGLRRCADSPKVGRLGVDQVHAVGNQRDCVTAAATGFVEGTALYKQCVGEPNPTISKAINDAELKAHQSVGHQQALLSEDESIFFASADEVRAARRWYGDMPLIVLTSAPVTKPRANETAEFRAALNRLHAVLADQMAALSTRGRVRSVPNSTHEIQLSQPDAVNSAILEVLGQARQQR